MEGKDTKKGKRRMNQEGMDEETEAIKEIRTMREEN